jgi:hypothetical protein
MKAVPEADEKKRKRMMPTSSVSGDSHGAPPKYRMVHTLAGVSCTDHNHSRTGAITHNSNHGNSNRHNSSSSTVLLPHHCSRLPSDHHSSFPPVSFPGTTMGRWGTLFKSAASPSKVTHCELQHPWSINRRVLCHALVVPTIPPWRRFP